MSTIRLSKELAYKLYDKLADVLSVDEGNQLELKYIELDMGTYDTEKVLHIIPEFETIIVSEDSNEQQNS